MTGKPPTSNYTCADYRLEMMLLGLEKQLQDPSTPEEQQKELREEVKKLRRQLEME